VCGCVCVCVCLSVCVCVCVCVCMRALRVHLRVGSTVCARTQQVVEARGE